MEAWIIRKRNGGGQCGGSVTWVLGERGGGEVTGSIIYSIEKINLHTQYHSVGWIDGWRWGVSEVSD